MHEVDIFEPHQFSGAKGSNQSGIRDHNERLLLSILRRRGAMAKADIARSTGLSAQTVSNIMRQLESDGLIAKGEPQRGRVGQPSVPISLAEDGAYFWGLKIGRRSADLVLTNFLGEVVARRRRTYRYPTPDDTVAFAEGAISEIQASLPATMIARIAGLGIAMPFQIWRWAREISVAPDTMADWKGFDIVSALDHVCDGGVFLQNDASAACGAELVFGTGDAPTNFLYVYIGYFIGGGVVLGGTLFTGPTGNAGAVGPLPVLGPDGKITQLLDVSSLSLLERSLREAGHDTEAVWHAAEDWRVPEDLLALWVETTAGGLAQAIPAALSIIDFEAVLIDGWMPPDLRERIVRATQARLARANMTGLNTPDIREGTVGSDARALGAASLPLSQRFLLEAPVRA